MEDKDKNFELQKEQLLSEMSFLGYCNEANDNRVTMFGKFHQRVEPLHLRAMEKDGFLKPLLVADTEIRQQDGTTKIEPVSYYSPFQVFIVSHLIRNEINDEGNLQSPNVDKEWQKTQKSRFVNWGRGGMSFNIEHKTRREENAMGGPSELVVCDYFHNFLTFLHSLNKPERYSDEWDREMERYYTRSPNLQFSMKQIEGKGEETLKKYDLDVEKLKILYRDVGGTALSIDPLEKWYPFVRRLPQWRRDELKGEALLAQELYGLCEVIADIVEIISGKRPKPLSEELDDRMAYDHKRNEYASGTDIEAIKLACSKLEDWLKNENKSKVVNEFLGPDIIPNSLKQLDKIKKQLEDYEKRYKKHGEGRYVNSSGFLHFSERNTNSISIEELDEHSKKMALQMLAQIKAQGEVEDENAELQEEIRHAIRWCLDDIERALVDLIVKIEHPLNEHRWRLDSEKQNGPHHGSWWMEYISSGEAPKDEKQVHTDFVKKFLPKKHKEYDKKIEPIKEATGELWQFIRLASYVLCAHCRKNTVLLHQAHNDGKVSSEAICDDCLSKGDFNQIKGGEWCCAYCGRMIYKFAHGNILSDVLLNHSNATIQLNYGKISIKARCPNKECKKWNEDEIDWGWLL